MLTPIRKYIIQRRIILRLKDASFYLGLKRFKKELLFIRSKEEGKRNFGVCVVFKDKQYPSRGIILRCGCFHISPYQKALREAEAMHVDIKEHGHVLKPLSIDFSSVASGRVNRNRDMFPPPGVTSAIGVTGVADISNASEVQAVMNMIDNAYLKPSARKTNILKPTTPKPDVKPIPQRTVIKRLTKTVRRKDI
ncbi:hypothetical protein LDC_0856 [sediment metagenome]|uniref:Uncharacterized protein n=1 Tax=sediment metagenome TaxID=749907 RepID=D9PH57_9ZZZZ